MAHRSPRRYGDYTRRGVHDGFQIFGVVAIFGAVVMALTVNPERDRARIAAIDTLTSADGSVDDKS